MKIILTIFLIAASSLFAQTDSTFQFTLPELKILQLEKNKEVTYEFADERNMFLMSDSFLIANPDKYNYVVRIADIKKVSIRDGTHVWKTARIIGAVGGGFGLLVGIGFYALISKNESSNIDLIIPVFTISGALAGGLIGALVGLTAPYYESYPQTERDAGKKKEVLKKIFKNYNLNKR